MSLLYLMRVPPRKPFVSYAIDSADYGENGTCMYQIPADAPPRPSPSAHICCERASLCLHGLNTHSLTP